MNNIQRAADLINKAKHLTVFTGAGISVESGIPPFRGEGGLWNTYDPVVLYMTYFQKHPRKAWEVIKEIFFDHFGHAEPNGAHKVLAKWERAGRVKQIITQNIDNLHQKAGSEQVIEFHGNSRDLICMDCQQTCAAASMDLTQLPPSCATCGGLLKPDFIFFGEAIPQDASERAFKEIDDADLFLVIGTTGEVMPACSIPAAAQRGTPIIEINTAPSAYTPSITDIFLKDSASQVLADLDALLP